MGDLCMGKSFGLKEAENTKMRHVLALLEGIMVLFQPVSQHFFLLLPILPCTRKRIAPKQQNYYSWTVDNLCKTDNAQIANSPFVPLWLWLKPRGLDWVFDKYGPSAARAWRGFVRQCLQERTKVEEGIAEKAPEPQDVRKDFFHYLFKYKDPDTGKLVLSRNELWMECELLIVAGANTTATVLAALFFYLVHNQDVQERLASEIQSEFSHINEIVAGPKLHACKFLRAVISEGLRLAPPVAAELPRTVLPGGTYAEGHFFPPGVDLSICTYCLGLNEDVFPEPFQFRPERWMKDMEGSSEESVKLAESGLSAFWAGSRGCAGKNLA